MKLEDLSPELREKAQACTTMEEVLALAQEEGIELSEDDLESVSGGWGTCPDNDYCSSYKGGDKFRTGPKK